MNKRGWFIPILIVAVNALAILLRWSSLSELLPAHFDLQGNASGSISRNILLVYPFIGAVISLLFYGIARIKKQFQTGLVILSSGICLIFFLSALVTLTHGTLPVLMLAEPVVLLISVVAFVVSLLKSRKVQL